MVPVEGEEERPILHYLSEPLRLTHVIDSLQRVVWESVIDDFNVFFELFDAGLGGLHVGSEWAGSGARMPADAGSSQGASAATGLFRGAFSP